jgi:hypothetical protein
MSSNRTEESADSTSSDFPAERIQLLADAWENLRNAKEAYESRCGHADDEAIKQSLSRVQFAVLQSKLDPAWLDLLHTDSPAKAFACRILRVVAQDCAREESFPPGWNGAPADQEASALLDAAAKHELAQEVLCWLESGFVNELIPKLLDSDTVPANELDAAQASTIIPPTLATPAKLLLSWNQILSALELKRSDVSNRQLASLNKRYSGPIILPGKGGQPKVDKARLLQWWSGLENMMQEKERIKADTRATVQEQYPHGRSETVVPDIAGHVKKRSKRSS